MFTSAPLKETKTMSIATIDSTNSSQKFTFEENPEIDLMPKFKIPNKKRFDFDSNDNQMANLFNTIEEIRKGSEGEDLKLPQMCVIGMQSSGKSSQLTSISDQSFPEASKTCTKCPIIVNLRKENNICLKLNGEKLESQAPEDQQDNDLFSQLQSKMKELNDGNKDIVDKPITIEYSDPDIFPLTLVDLPGIKISTDEGEKATKNIIEKYIKPDNAVILVIQPANQDKDTTSGKKLAREFDPDGIRTIEILTKADEVVNIQNIEDIIEDINSQKSDLFSTHIVSCRDSKGEKNTYESEMNVFRQDKWKNSKFERLNINNGNVGMQKLREEKLPKLLAYTIMQNFPALEKDIESKLDEAKNILNQIGEKEEDQVSVLTRLYDSLQSSMIDLKYDLTPHTEEISQAIFEISENIQKEDLDKYYRPNNWDCTLFSGEPAFNSGIKDYSEKCMDEFRKKSKEIKDIALRSISENESLKNTRYIPLKRFILDKWKDKVDEIFKKLIKKVETLVYDTSKFNTRNQDFTSKFEEDMALPKELKEKFAQSFTKNDFANKTNSDEDQQNFIFERLNNFTDEHFRKFKNKDIHEQQKIRVYTAVKNYIDFVRKIFDDNILCIIRRVIIDTRTKWQNGFFLGDQNLKGKVKEGNEISLKRDKALITKANMEKCKQKLKEHRNRLNETS